LDCIINLGNSSKHSHVYQKMITNLRYRFTMLVIGDWLLVNGY